jgi:VWFA-related protein
VADEPPISVAISNVDDSNFPVLSVVMSADIDGRPVAGLDATSVQVTENGQPGSVVSVERATNADIPLTLGIVIDTSGSMAGDAIARAKQSAVALVASLGPRDTATVLAFADGVRVVQPLTQDKNALTAAINQLTAVGNTALYDAVFEATRLVSAPGSSRRAVVLLSDGEEAGGRSSHSRPEALGAAASGGAVFYVVALGAEVDRSFLDGLANGSGGRVYPAPAPADVPGIYASIETLLRSQFVVRFRTAILSGNEDETLAIRVTAQGRTGAGERSAKIRRPTPAAVPTSTPATQAAQTPQLPPQEKPAARPSGDGGMPAGAIAAIVLVLAGAGGGGVIAWRRKRAGGEVAPTVTQRTFKAPPSLPADERVGTLVVTAGPMESQSFPIGAAPLTLGSADSCSVGIPDGPEVAPEHVRLWWRDGLLMLHHLPRGHETLVNGTAVEWASLADGQEFSVGEHTFRYERGA